MKSWVSYSYRPPTKLREGNVFTGVYHSVDIEGQGRTPGTVPSPRTVHTEPYPLPERQKQSVCIILEWFLVFIVFGISKMCLTFLFLSPETSSYKWEVLLIALKYLPELVLHADIPIPSWNIWWLIQIACHQGMFVRAIHKQVSGRIRSFHN